MLGLGTGPSPVGPARLGTRSWTGAGGGKGSGRADGHGDRYAAVQVPGPNTGSVLFLSPAWGEAGAYGPLPNSSLTSSGDSSPRWPPD